MFFDIFLFFQILQNLGKADKTTDEIFEDHLQNFNTQQVRSIILASVSDPGSFFSPDQDQTFFLSPDPDPYATKSGSCYKKNLDQDP